MADAKLKEKSPERRKSPRAELSFEGILVAADNREIEIKSVNVSESGMLIAAREPLEEFTVISAVVRLPSQDNGPEGVDFYCEGVVVRIEYDNSSDYPYRIAVHFSKLEPEVRSAIRDMVYRANGTVPKPH